MPDNGCFAVGTTVVLANGKTKNIEDLMIWDAESKEGDSVMTLDGRGAVIVDLIEGTEALPLVFIDITTVDIHGEKHHLSIALTEKHPVVVRYNYLVLAAWLQTGDEVHTVFGSGLITNVRRESPGSKVWNMVLTGEEFLKSGVYKDEALQYAYATNSLLGLPPKAHIVFANGIAMATWPLQTQLSSALRNGVNLSTFN
jgi:hypothetical protein